MSLFRNRNTWQLLTGLSGASAVALGAIGAHALLKKPEAMRETWKTASLYHLVHTVALGLCSEFTFGRKKTICCSLFFTGIVLFSGSCYMVVIMETRQPYS